MIDHSVFAQMCQVKFGAGGSAKRFEFVLQELLSELELKKRLKFEGRAEDRSETSFWRKIPSGGFM